MQFLIHKVEGMCNMKKYLALTSAVSALLVSGSLIAAPVATIVEETTTTTVASEASAPVITEEVVIDQAASGEQTQSASQLMGK